MALWLARAIALAVGVVVVARAVGGEQKTPLVQLALMVPFAVVAAAVALVAALLARERRNVTAVVLAVLLAVQVVWLAPSWGIGVGAAEAGEQAQPVRVMTVNTLTGLADASVIVDEVRERQVDLLVVVELTPLLDRRLERAGLTDLLPHRIGHTDWGAGGTRLFSRTPIESLEEIGGTQYGQPRGVVRLPSGRAVTVTAIHTLSPIPGRVQRWRGEVAAIERGLAEVGGPQIVLGDFNAERGHRGFRRLLGDELGLVDAADVLGVRGGAWPGFTWPANKDWLPPVVRLDHVLISRDTLGVERLETVRVPGTDHLALFAVLTG